MNMIAINVYFVFLKDIHIILMQNTLEMLMKPFEPTAANNRVRTNICQ